jgi:hypothetical protein
VEGYLFSSNLWYIREIIPKSSKVDAYNLLGDVKNNTTIKMIKNFLIINCTGQNDKIGLRINNNFFISNFQTKTRNNDVLTSTILSLITKHKANINKNFSVLVNNGPGSYSAIRVALAVAKGIEIAKKAKIFGYKSSDLPQFNLENIEVLINKNLIENKLIKPLYTS